MRVTRRAFLASGTYLGGPSLWLAAAARAAPAGPRGDIRFASARNQLAELEHRAGGRLGVSVLDTATGLMLSRRGSERFAMCSAFKFIAVAAMLERVDRNGESLERRISYSEQDLLEYAPVTREHVKDGGMSLRDLCAAAIEQSDNTAANLILAELGGPAAVTRYARSQGDLVTRLDRTEPDLNVVRPGEVLDTSTSDALVRLLQQIVIGPALSDPSRRQIEEWMLNCRTGRDRVAAGLPVGLKIADKTGTGHDQTNDVGVIWPPGRSPLVFAVLFSNGRLPMTKREIVLRDVGQIVAGVW